MKKSFLLSFLLTSISLVCILPAQVPFQRIDSIVNFNWLGAGQHELTSKYEFHYDSKQEGNIFAYYGWDDASSTWYGRDSIVFSFNAKGLFVGAVNWETAGAGFPWYRDYRSEVEYTSFDSIRKTVNYYADEKNGNFYWLPEERVDYDYYPNQSLKEKIWYDWVEVNGQWEMDSKYEYFYRGPGKNYVIHDYEYDNGSWVLDDSTVYLFNAQGQPVSEHIIALKNDGTINYEILTRYTYNAQGQLISIKDTSSTRGLGKDYREFSYAPNGDLFETLYYKWDIRDWEKDRLKRSRFDQSTGWLTDTFFNVSGSFLFPRSAFNTQFDTSYELSDLNLFWEPFYLDYGFEGGERGKAIAETWNFDLFRNRLDRDSTHYYYSNAPAVGITPSIPQTKLTIAPNPANNFLNISSDKFLIPGLLTIRDMQGRQVDQFVWKPNSRVSIENLKDGVYFLELFQGANKHVSRFIKTH